MNFRRSTEQHPAITSGPAPVLVVRGEPGALSFWRGFGAAEMTAHSPVPHYHDGWGPDPTCTLLDGLPCYAEAGSAPQVTGTDDEVFAQMEAGYASWFPERGE